MATGSSPAPWAEAAAVPPPPGGPPVGVALYVEPTGGGKATGGVLMDGPALKPKKERGVLTDAGRWFPAYCAKPPCFERLVFRPSKVPLEETLTQLEHLAKSALFRSKPPHVRFTFRCPKGASQSREDAIAGPWGPREPNRPCF